ncbi:4-hydroxyphenylacetate 3-hydroxylase N-terminal domain-containing protein [Nitratireductor indicus]|uniref:4-hydroxyphenylacetate 3-hydroxylase N-terminal domain-containing protein n=1 Tax=Nitratireductor indicus TaxID=721133 RepID=UPI0028752F68|nr:4-hydroxyphenylacetate 3-hydroxylase N-terminal domain-containing protein [Nitratireductor indicus]MDS1137717.1 4-hydroxyphenylacetate 3-hydroxylase N-terminal domain-containing protein [Nitratireductor indicus]
MDQINVNADAITDAYTGDAFLESIRDGREIYIYGERVKDVTTHPAFRNSARMVARWYDRFHQNAAEIGVPCDNGSSKLTHPFFLGSRTSEDLVKSKQAIMDLQQPAFGWMGRSPDYKASFLGTLGANSAFYGEYAGNARSWYDRTQQRLDYWNHAIVNPPIDRDRPIEEVADVFMHVERETDAGVIVSGAKVVATGSALTHYNFIAHYGIPIKDKKFALIFTVPMGAEGVKLIARQSYEAQAAVMGSPFDYPLSSRLDENDSILVFDKVLVPWENIFIYGDAEKVNAFFPASGFVPRFTLHGVSRFAVKLDFIAGLFSMAVDATGSASFRGVQAAVGETLAWRNTFHGLADAMVKSPIPWQGTDGYNLPNVNYGLAYRVLAPLAYPRIKELIEQNVASGLIYLPSSAADFESPAIRPYLDRFVRGSNGYAAIDRVKLLKLLWDAIGSEFGGRHELYERNYAGNQDNLRIETLLTAQATGELEMLQDMARRCMSEYDLKGWVSKDLINPNDVSALHTLAAM